MSLAGRGTLELGAAALPPVLKCLLGPGLPLCAPPALIGEGKGLFLHCVGDELKRVQHLGVDLGKRRGEG